jgi:caffeoyl-CoA O-methyltransferase
MADPNSRAGTTYLTPAIDEYLRGLNAGETPGMRDSVASMEAAGMPAIQVSPTDGRIIELLLRLAGARKVVEVGTLAGYSAQWILQALPPDGHLWTVEHSAKHREVSEGVLKRAGLADRVTVLQGAGLEVLPTIERHGPFDAVFVDANKEHYAEYAAWALRNLRLGGLVIGDNTYLFSRLVGVEPENEAQARDQRAMRAFHELLASESAAAVTIPTPDGLTVAIKR